MGFHKDLDAGNIHIPYQWEYANEAARTGASGFVSTDVGKFARQLDDNSIWMLTATTPTWGAVNGSSEFSGDASDIPTDETGINVQEKLDILDAKTASDIETDETGKSIQDKIDELEAGGGGGGAAKASCVIGDGSTGTTDVGTVTSVEDWQDSGPYTSEIVHGLTISASYPWELKVICYQLVSSEYVEVVPSEIKVTDNTKFTITMPTNGDLYVSVIG